jgi:hypothetical protein
MNKIIKCVQLSLNNDGRKWLKGDLEFADMKQQIFESLEQIKTCTSEVQCISYLTDIRCALSNVKGGLINVEFAKVLCNFIDLTRLFRKKPCQKG